MGRANPLKIPPLTMIAEAFSRLAAENAALISAAPRASTATMLSPAPDAAARALFLRAHRMSAVDAHRLGLIDEICPAADLDAVVQQRLGEIALGAASSHRATKALLAALAPLPGTAQRRLTAEAIARQRVSEDGQEGLRAFLERRPPAWQSRGPSSA